MRCASGLALSANDAENRDRNSSSPGRDYKYKSSAPSDEMSHRKEILVAYGVDVDAVAGWLGSYGGEDSPDDISRGLFAGEVGVPRLLKLFEKYKIKTSWFIPGHSIETFPEETRMVVKAGHEIGLHGYSHENPIALTRKQEEDVMAKCVSLIKEVAGEPPQGYVAPW